MTNKKPRKTRNQKTSIQMPDKDPLEGAKLKNFTNFWNNVSSLKIGQNADPEVTAAIVSNIKRFMS